MAKNTSSKPCEIDTKNNSIKNISPKCQEDIFSLVHTTETGKEKILQKHLSVLRTNTEKATNDDLPPGSATIVDLNYYRKNFNYPDNRVKLGNQYVEKKTDDKVEIVQEDVNSFNQEIQFIIQAAPAGFRAANISNQSVTNSVYNCLYLAEKHDVQGIAFPIIGGQIFFNALNIIKNKLYEILFQGVADYFNDFKDSKIEVVLFAGSKRVDDDDDFEKTFNGFIASNPLVKDKLKQIQTGIFGAYYLYNNDSKSKTKISALVNAANTYITFNNVSGLALAFKNMLGGVGEKNVDILNTLHDKESLNDSVFNIADDITKQGEEIKTAFKTAVDEYIKKPTAASSTPPKDPTPEAPEAPEAPPVKKTPFANVLKELEGALTNASENDAEIKTLGITLPTDFLYPTDGDASTKKNLNCATPLIEEMITAFETADGDDTKFYLGACRSIQAAYDLEMKAITGVENSDEVKAANMRAKLLLNLRKNSLLLKVPARWDYATMQPGEEPELTEEEVEAKYKELQQECEELKGGYESEAAYKLAEQLIPLDEKMEIDKLEKKNKFVEENKPTTTYDYNPVEIKYDDSKGGFTLVVIQSSLNCGRAALSNFFGNKDLLVKGNPLQSDIIFDLKKARPDNSIDMGSICNLNKTYYDIFNDKVGNKEERIKDEKNNACPDFEEYSYQVLLRVLNVLGYNADDDYNFSYNINTKYNGPSANNEDNYITSIQPKINELTQTAKDKKYLGYLVNLGRGHWICYKREELNTDKDSFFRINSFEESNITDKNDPMTLSKLIDYEINITKSVKNLYVFPIYAETTSNLIIFAKLARLYKTKTSEGGNKIDEIDIDSYANDIKRNQINYKWKLFMKEITSELIKDTSYNSDDQPIKTMAILKNLPDDVFSPESKNDILKKNSIIKNKIKEIFIAIIKEKIKELNITKKKYDTHNYIQEKDGIFNYTQLANDKFFYNINSNETYDPELMTAQLSKFDIIGLSTEIMFKIKEIPENDVASSASGGFKPTHNTTITNHTASKSKHNTSFKASSSSKAKVKSRSHTQRVK